MRGFDKKSLSLRLLRPTPACSHSRHDNDERQNSRQSDTEDLDNFQAYAESK